MEEALLISNMDKPSPQLGLFYGNVWILAQILTYTTPNENLNPTEWISWNFEGD